MSSPTTPDHASAGTHRRIAAATTIVMASVLLSRVLGFARDWAVAHLAGANGVTDAYNTAFTLPDILNYLIAGGSLSITFIPVFAKYVAERREDEGWRVFSTVMTVMGVVMVALIAVGEIFAGPIVRAMEPGFDSAEYARTVFLTRLMLPAQFFFYQGSILSAVQYAKGKFTIPSLAPLVYNAAIILGGLLLFSSIGITGFSVGVVTGAAAGNFLLQVYGAKLVGASFSPNFDVRHPGFLLFLRLSIPIMLALGLAQSDDWIIRHYASYLQHGAVTWLAYGKKIMQVPLGFVGQAIAVASFPTLAQLYSERKYGELNRILNGTFKVLIILLVPISTFMIAESRPLIRVLFFHTPLLKAADYTAIAEAMAYFSLGLFSWGAQNILGRGFYATRNTIVPAVVGTLTTLCSLPLYIWLLRTLQHRGLALASSLGISAYAIVLFVLLARRTENHEVPSLLTFLSKVTAGSLIAGMACYELSGWLGTFFDLQRPLLALCALAINTAAGIVLLFILLKLLRVSEVDAYARRAIGMLRPRRNSAATV